MRMGTKAKTKNCCNVLAVYSLLHFAGREHFSGVLDGCAYRSSSRENGTITSKYPSASTIGARCP
jgi:hypothetical protein